MDEQEGEDGGDVGVHGCCMRVSERGLLSDWLWLGAVSRGGSVRFGWIDRGFIASDVRDSAAASNRAAHAAWLTCVPGSRYRQDGYGYWTAISTSVARAKRKDRDMFRMYIQYQ